MKLLLLSLFVGAAIAIDIDFSKVRPVYEIPSFQKAHPNFAQFVNKQNSLFGLDALDGRITNGQEAQRHQVPHQVGLFLHFPDGVGLCGGSVISTEYVLTAAHCIDV